MAINSFCPHLLAHLQGKFPALPIKGWSIFPSSPIKAGLSFQLAFKRPSVFPFGILRAPGPEGGMADHKKRKAQPSQLRPLAC